MPTNNRLRLNDSEHSSDRRKPIVKLHQKQPIDVREMNPATKLTPQHHHLVPKRDVFGLKPAFRLEWQDQNGDEAEQHQHCALTLGDSVS